MFLRAHALSRNVAPAPCRLRRLEELEARAREVIAGLQAAEAPPARTGPGGGSGGGGGAQPEAPDVGGTSDLEPGFLHQVLESLGRVEAAEREIAARWLAEGNDGGEAEAEAEPETAAGAAAAAADAGVPPSGPVGHAADLSSGRVQERQHAREQAQQPEPVPDAALRSILAGRRRFLRWKAALDGADPSLGAPAAAPPATAVVEAVADALVDEAVARIASEIGELCDGLCEGLLAAEFGVQLAPGVRLTQ